MKATRLLDAHRRLGAKLTAFGGWDMPLHYQGNRAEHTAVRTACGLFDVSHLGKLLLSGPAAAGSLQAAVTCDVDNLEPGMASYALVLNDDAGCIDDVFVYRLSEDRWLVVPNASNVDAVAEALRDGGGRPEDEWDRWSILALQGPAAFDVFRKVFPASTATELRLHRWTGMEMFGDEDGFVARTGYTGERGFEIYAPTAVAERTWEALLENGAVPAGLAARDTLRLEMGYALYGHELSLQIDPLQAGLGWAIAWDAPFRGRDALLKIKEQGPERKLFGIKLTDKGVPRQGYPVIWNEQVVGEVASGNFSPTLGTGIALAFAPAGSVPQPGDEVAVEARGRHMRGDIVKPPFIPRGTKT
jgi:aminomethyltransferase